MNLRLNNSSRHAVSLIECLLYIALFLVVATLAFASYYRVDEETRALNRNSDDIVRAMKAGEQWRADVRAATAPPRSNNGVLTLPTKSGDVIYSVREEVLWRQSGQGKAMPVLERVKSSSMQADARQDVRAWRWELELRTKRAQARVRPLFTFIAVSAGEVAR
jgi:hypothetical protein